MRTRAVLICLAFALTAGACSVHRLDDGDVAAGSPSTTPGTVVAPGQVRDDTSSGEVDETPSGSTSGGSAGRAGTSGGGGGGGGGDRATPPERQPTANPTSPSEPRTASDQGVSPDEIQLGILHTDDAFFAVGGTSTKGVEEVIAPFVAEINEQGGIHGRTVVPRISTYDPLSAESMNAACVEQAEDHRVFASIAQLGFYGDAEVCMATKQIPLLTNNNSTHKTNHERERGWVRQTNQNKDRNSKNWIDWMIASGLLQRGSRTGLVYVDVPEDRDLVHQVVLPYLESKGMPRPVLATLSPSIAQTPTEAQSAVLKFRAENVDLVLPYVSFLRILIFAEQAEAFNYRPGYSVSDFGLLASDAMAGMPPAQWEGVTGITVMRTGLAEPGGFPVSDAWKDCFATYRARGQDIARDGEGNIDGVEVANVLHYCEHLALWADAARRAGVNPTRRDLLAAFDATGTWAHRVGLTERLTFGPGKYDGADLFSVVRWQSGCTDAGGCYRQVEGFRPGQW